MVQNETAWHEARPLLKSAIRKLLTRLASFGFIDSGRIPYARETVKWFRLHIQVYFFAEIQARWWRAFFVARFNQSLVWRWKLLPEILPWRGTTDQHFCGHKTCSQKYHRPFEPNRLTLAQTRCNNFVRDVKKTFTHLFDLCNSSNVPQNIRQTFSDGFRFVEGIFFAESDSDCPVDVRFGNGKSLQDVRFIAFVANCRRSRSKRRCFSNRVCAKEFLRRGLWTTNSNDRADDYRRRLK